MVNKVFIATSLDNYIADVNGDIHWLTDFPNPSNNDGGFAKFMESVDAVLMGRKTFDKVLSFGIEWPYHKKVFVWSNTIKFIPQSLVGKVEIISGSINEIIKLIQIQNIKNLYVDGGQTIQSFLREKQIHEIIITQVPIILGQGISLFKDVPLQKLQHQSTQVFDNGMVQTHYTVVN